MVIKEICVHDDPHGMSRRRWLKGGRVRGIGFPPVVSSLLQRHTDFGFQRMGRVGPKEEKRLILFKCTENKCEAILVGRGPKITRLKPQFMMGVPEPTVGVFKSTESKPKHLERIFSP